MKKRVMNAEFIFQSVNYAQSAPYYSTAVAQRLWALFAWVLQSRRKWVDEAIEITWEGTTVVVILLVALILVTVVVVV